MAVGDEVVAAVGIRDTIRQTAEAAIHDLRHLGIGHVVMLTGDQEAAARAVAEELSIAEFHSGLLPAEKAEWIAQFREAHAPLAMVGDGINDAPSLVAADVGVALADIGSDVTIESADLVLMGDDLRKLAEAVACGRRVLRTIRQNIIAFAIVFNLASVAAASSGWISPVTAAVVHQVSSLAVVLNSLRLLVDVHAWRQRLGDWWYDIKRLRLADRRRRRGGRAGRLSGQRAAHDRRGRAGRGPAASASGSCRWSSPGCTIACRIRWPGITWSGPSETHRVEIGFRSVPTLRVPGRPSRRPTNGTSSIAAADTCRRPRNPMSGPATRT